MRISFKQVWPFITTLFVLTCTNSISFLHDNIVTLAIGGILLCVGGFLNGKIHRINRIDVCFIASIFSLAIITVICGRFYASNLIIVLFFISGYLYIISCEQKKGVQQSIVVFTILNCCLLTLQFLHIIPQSIFFSKFGLFDNSGYLSLLCAISIGILMENDKREHVPLVIFLSIPPIVLLSRTALIAIAFVFFHHITSKCTKRIYLIGLIITLILCCIVFYQIKPLSANSRLLTWSSLLHHMIITNSWLGNGMGSISRDYMFMQQSLLSSFPSTHLALVADNNHQVYNDYLRILYEGGLVTFIAMTAFITSATKQQWQSRKVSFIVPIISMFFMNIMDIAPLALCSLAVLYDAEGYSNHDHYALSTRLASLAIFLMISFAAILYFNYRTSEKGIVQELRPALAYAKKLNQTASKQNIETVKRIITSTCCTYEMLTDLAECQLQIGDTTNAIASLTMADQMVPNRIVAKSALLNIYETQKDTIKIYSISESIVNSQTKLQGSLYFKARTKAKRILENRIPETPKCDGNLCKQVKMPE